MGVEGFPKIPRLSKEMVVTEKIDGTNASVWIEPGDGSRSEAGEHINAEDTYVVIRAASRKRFLTPEKDNFGFARWVGNNAEELVKLGEGRHYGEWWGQGIQRNYGLKEKWFSLFNVGRWIDPYNAPGDPVYGDELAPRCCHVVPVTYYGAFDTQTVLDQLEHLREYGSYAAPGYMNPEGVCIYHIAAKQYFKKTFEKDGGKDQAGEK